MKNYIPQGLNHVVEILNKSKDFLNYYDPDIDGVVSGELFERFLRYFGKQSEIMINSLRQHGMKIPKSEWHKLKGKTVLVVDAGMKKELLIEMVDYGINVINLDHHDISYDHLVYYENGDYSGVMINNNYSFEPKEWSFLSGAGVVYYTLQNIYPLFGEEEQALVGLTLLSDVRDLSTAEAKEFLWKTYSVRTPYLAYLVDVTAPEKNYGFGNMVLDRNYIDYTFSPKINAALRCGFEWEIVDLFKGCYPYDNMRLTALRELQNKIVNDMMNSITIQEYSNLLVTRISSNYRNLEGIDITTMVGLTCSRLLSKHDKNVIMLVMNEDGTVKRGSLRGRCHDVDYLHLFRSFGVVAEGHSGAFGILEFSHTVDIEGINRVISEMEEGYEFRKYDGRIREVSNLSVFIMSELFAQIADYNNYVRDYERIYLRYTGSIARIEEKVIGKKIDVIVDGVTVTCFDSDLSISNDLILPLTERGGYKNLFLHRY